MAKTIVVVGLRGYCCLPAPAVGARAGVQQSADRAVLHSALCTLDGFSHSGNTQRMTARFFSVEQANNALPLVRRIVEDLVADHSAWRDAVSAFEWHAGESKAVSPERDALSQRVSDLAERIEGYSGELAAIGCVCKDFSLGLIDFFGRHEGRDVFLCWKLGGAAVEYWHEIDGGFGGRQSVDTLVTQESLD